VLSSGGLFAGEAWVEVGSSSLALLLGDLLLSRPLTGDAGGEENGDVSARLAGVNSLAPFDRSIPEAFFAFFLSSASSLRWRAASLTTRWAMRSARSAS
jgi:hypothetical protein